MKEIRLRTRDFSLHPQMFQAALQEYISTYCAFKNNPSNEKADDFIQIGIFLCLYAFFPRMQKRFMETGNLDTLTATLIENINDNLIMIEDFLKKGGDSDWTTKF